MTGILAPEASVTFVVALLVPLLIGFLVGVVAKSVIKVGIAVAIIALVLIAAGFVTPNQVIEPFIALFKSGPSLVNEADRIASYLPYSSIAFIIGLVLGFIKG